MRILHAKPETACAKMSEFGSFCVHHVALNGEAVKSNGVAAEVYILSLAFLRCLE